mmetsp:Transcript_5849/g.17545  ORF Transcript_5849/g.17545 Transcript_5849/m.17545 type:complete len:272 (-) Transcript_5849:63-878(-)|eukprot:CAMPEP_0198724372 /NCGR_PEP_ID=MMETSP1475-20131203/1853_1 /TAXON_ID= ORGANISM="Unidentified sp., Strain CCMP1999" /NCGR_SAMPLE_ID=MMETSP1475 /ASSEMBLY_ACC=CAM_ASM_001111 /LENGTH=271 /DNA_ID=CAMNT_0044485881 /DNA_START=118 /DNA_END=933 /DNA_ORIENTATION=-
MAVGKNKRLSKKGKGAKKRVGDPFLKKDWYDVKAPSNFKIRNVGKTLVSKTQGTKIASDGLKGRVFEVSLADLMKGEDFAYRKIKLKCEEIQGSSCLTSFHGMDFTRDRHCFLIKKKQTLIEAHIDVKTTDNFTLRIFCMGFTKRDKPQKDQPVRTAYAQTSQVRKIRKQMVDIMQRESSSCDLKELVNKFIHEFIGKEIEKACESIYPLQDVYIRKVKILRAPKFDISKLMDMHGGPDVAAEEDAGEAVERPPEPIPGAEEEADTTQATA